MRYKWLIAVLFPSFAFAQTLTVEKIMRDPKWIGSSPENVFWSRDSRNVYFDWNPEKKMSDSTYRISITEKVPVRVDYRDATFQATLNNATYNKSNTHMTYSMRGDLYFTDLKNNKTFRITQTEEAETNPAFIRNDEWITFSRNQNLFAWNTKTGETEQLTNFVRIPASNTPRTSMQDEWLQREQLQLFDILKERKEKRDARTAFLRTVRDTDTLKAINIGEKLVQGISPNATGRYIAYRLFTAVQNNKSTIVPAYVTENGYTTDISARTKVGNALGRSELFLFDAELDTVFAVLTDSIPGITDLPDYVKDYPKANRRATARAVNIGQIVWNESGTVAVVDIRSQDNKDRWLMKLDPRTGKLSLIDRQRDNAWIGGPGMFGTLGWLNDNTIYFQSEATGYSHVYSYDINSNAKQALTKGNYEVQQLRLSRDKKTFYLLANEAHPGKQHWYRMKVDGSQKEQITLMDGLYDVTMSPDEKYIAYRYSYINKPYELFIQENAPGKKPTQITDKAISSEFASYPWRETKIFTIKARDGKDVYTRMYEPAAGKKNGAAVIFVHGAGYLQNVHYGWSSYFREYMFNNLLADLGYTVIEVDYRASSGYGRDWRTGIYRFMGGKDLEDHVDAAAWLVKEQGIDAKRIGIYGGSYGGFITLMGLFTTPDVFKAGAALRPVTDWAHYNHGYTANILNEPVTDSIAYAKSSPINYAAGLKNNLLICHGMVDVNVHFQDVVRLTQRLIELKKENWELAVYPMEDHGFVEPTSWMDEYKRILKLFNDHLTVKAQ
jgi:dipeptidyl aminopeptidase/acylaminoacyl peptidase